MTQRYLLATPRALPFLDANKIPQHRFSTGEMCRRRLEHVPSKRDLEAAELRHGVDGNVEKLANQRCISMHNDSIRRVKDKKQVKVADWIHRQLASISNFHAVLDQETINLSPLATTDSASDLVIGIENR